MFSEIVNSIKANLYERIVSPLSGAFLIALILSNYETVLLIFDSQDYYKKISFISNNLYPSFEWAFWKLFLLPALCSAVFILAYPWPSRWAYQYWMGQQKRLKDIKVKIENETPLTIRESRELRQKLAVLQAKYSDDLRSKEKEIDELNAIIAQSSGDAPEPPTRLELRGGRESESEDDMPSDLDDDYWTLENIEKDDNVYQFLSYLAKSSSRMKAVTLARGSGLKPVRCQYIAEKLQEMGLVRIEHETRTNITFYALTSEGRSFALRIGAA